MTFRDLRIVFAGTPELAAAHLQALIDNNCQVVCAHSQPARPSSAGKKISPSPVTALALDQAIPVRPPATLRTAEAQAALAEFAPDLMIVVASGLLLAQAVLVIPRLGCINVHASL